MYGYGLDEKIMENVLKLMKKLKQGIQKDGLKVLEIGYYINMYHLILLLRKRQINILKRKTIESI